MHRSLYRSSIQFCCSRITTIRSGYSVTLMNRSFATQQQQSNDDNKRQKSGSKSEDDAAIIKFDHQFKSIPEHLRNKQSFHTAIGLFLERNVQRRGQVDFVLAALKHLKEYGLHKDLDTYKALLNTFPKGKLIPTNEFQIKHYPKQQDCAVTLLDEMEWHGVCPDREISDMMINIFGRYNYATKKMDRMMYWSPKLKHSNIYLDRRTVEGKQLSASELAKIALKMISRDPATKLTQWMTDELPDSTLATWIVGAQSPIQQHLLNSHPTNRPLYVDGPFRVYVMHHPVNYLTLTADPDPNKNYSIFRDDIDDAGETEQDWRKWTSRWKSPKMAQYPRVLTIHEQAESTIIACASTGTSCKQSAAEWIELLQRTNQSLANINVVFRMIHATTGIVQHHHGDDEKPARS